MLEWYINRLRSMSVKELVYRFFQYVNGKIEEKLISRKKSFTGLLKSNNNILGMIPFRLNPKNGRTINIFETEFSYSKPYEINWHQDLISGKEFPRHFYSKINIRSSSDLSAKRVWEVNRMQFLTDLCLRYSVYKDPSDLQLFTDILRSWSDKNPYLLGVNWYSNIEVNLRLITWFFCWEILDAENLMRENDDFREFSGRIWMPLIEEHCLYSYEHPSKHSSANNHLISEYAGLFIASAKWTFRNSEKWIKYSQKGLEMEILLQHSENGVNREEAAEYIQFITDFFLLSYIVGERTGRLFSAEYKERLYKILCYIYDIIDCKGNFPKYGDEDDGKCFILDFNKDFNNFRSLLTSGAIIFNDSRFKSKDNGFDIKNRILFGEQAKGKYNSIPSPEIHERSKFYNQEGHFIFRKRNEDKEIYLHFDAAPIGFLSIAAHGHSDALSFLMHIDGQPVFVDSGTYTYHTDPEWRRYFMGTLAHNTVRINSKDQAVIGGPTLWLKHYKTTVLKTEMENKVERVVALHNGYKGEKVFHTREIVFIKDENEFQVTDTISVKGKRMVDVEIPFHIHPRLIIERSSDDSFLISSESGNRYAGFKVDDKLDPVLVKGQTTPEILGWYSESFMNKEATSVIYCKTQIDCTKTFKHIINIY